MLIHTFQSSTLAVLSQIMCSFLSDTKPSLTQLCADWLQTQGLDRKVCEAFVLSCKLETQ